MYNTEFNTTKTREGLKILYKTLRKEKQDLKSLTLFQKMHVQQAASISKVLAVDSTIPPSYFYQEEDCNIITRGETVFQKALYG